MSWLLLAHLGNCSGKNKIKQNKTEENTCWGERKVKRRFLKTAVLVFRQKSQTGEREKPKREK